MDLATLTDFAATLSSSTSFAGTGLGWLGLAFALGLVHAFDADHVMALSVFATRGRGAAEGARAGLRWSLGHGLVLLVAGLALLMIGRALPSTVSALADRAVGVVMIGLGIFVFVELARRRAHLHFHAHDGMQPHAHWHGHEQASAPGPREIHPHAHGALRHSQPHQHEHGALLVGALHGLAGSAPILAVLPVAKHSVPLALAYLGLFGLGVAVAMIGVSGMLGHVAGRLSREGAGRGLSWLRGLGAGGSVALGAWLAFAG